MSPRAARVLAWTLFGLVIVLMVSTVALVASGRGSDDLFVLFALGYALVGALVASRQPANAVGWLLLTIGIMLALGSLVDTNLSSVSAPAATLSAWLSDTTWYIWLTSAAIFLPLVFPNGQLVSQRWRPVLWLGVAALLTSLIAVGFAPGPLDVDPPHAIDNPLGIEGAAGVLSVLETLGNVLASAAFLSAGASLVVRFRRSRGTERQQLKWFAYVAMLAVAALAFSMAVVLFGGEGEDEPSSGLVYVIGSVAWYTALATIVIGIPLATGMAILRHRLYDIDVVIRRTLVYGALTATLVACYVGSVLLLQLVLSPDSDFAIAGSTLAVAALFRPASTRIQAIVDRRFYRRRYDAAKTIEEFSARLRDEVELEALSGELRSVVGNTMRPAHMSLWLRGSEAQR